MWCACHSVRVLIPLRAVCHDQAKAFFEDNPEEAEKLAAKVTEHLRVSAARGARRLLVPALR